MNARSHPCPFCGSERVRMVRPAGLAATCGARSCRCKAGWLTRATPKPVLLCACGCQRRCKRPGVTWATPACVPTSQRSAWGRQGRQAWMYRARRARFQAVFADLTREGQTITKDGILDAFMAIDRVAWQNGYHACEAKWRGRKVSAA